MGYVDEKLDDVKLKEESILSIWRELVNHSATILNIGRKFAANYFDKGDYDLKVERIKKYCYLLQKLNELSPLVDDV